MKRSLTLSVTAGALAAAISPAAFAQTDTNNTEASSPKTAKAVTCAELSMIDTATVPGVLYFVAGYSEGERTAAQDTAPENNTAADADATDPASEANGGEEDLTNEEASASADPSNVEVGRVAGYFDIPVEEIVVACEADPNRTIVDMLTEEGEAQKSELPQGDGAANPSENGTTAEGSAETTN